MKTIWHALGDIRAAFILLMAASATLFVGALYAGRHFSLFMELNRQRIQDWLPPQLSERFEVVWWIPLLFLIMGLLGINTFICATNRASRLIRQRRSLTTGRFVYLLIPSMVHFLFLMIMAGHLTTFTTGSWQTLPLSGDTSVRIGAAGPSYRVRGVHHRYFPESSALQGRIAQTTAVLENADRPAVRLQYARPVYMDGRYFLLDRPPQKKNRSGKARIVPAAPAETCNQAHTYVVPDKGRDAGGQLLLIVSDPGLAIIIAGLGLIMLLMIGFFLFKPAVAHAASDQTGAITARRNNGTLRKC